VCFPSDTTQKRVLPFRHDTKTYELDQVANERGHQVIRLPPYHCHFNPIELVWAQVKREVAKRIKHLQWQKSKD
jgi:transposase